MPKLGNGVHGAESVQLRAVHVSRDIFAVLGRHGGRSDDHLHAAVRVLD